jgi:hypothetical protein
VRYNKHLRLDGLHAYLSASNYHWINYDDAKLEARFRTAQAARLGTELHAYAAHAIRLGRYQAEIPDTLNMYINDAIQFGMEPERMLYYSYNCFGTPDTFCFDGRLLRVHDLKTGVSKVSFMQLIIYAALFCLEYDVRPYEIDFELRIYQSDEVQILTPDPAEIVRVMGRIVYADRRIEELREEAGL